MTEDQCRFYAVEILLALEEMHQHNLIYRYYHLMISFDDLIIYFCSAGRIIVI
jgi:serine/threonine protein kinase